MQDAVDRDTRQFAVVAEVAGDQFTIEPVDTGRDRGVGGEDGSGTDGFHRGVEVEPRSGELPDAFEPEEAGVPLVGVEDLGVRMAGEPAVGPHRAHPADAQQYLLEQPVFAAAAVEPVGDLAFAGGVVLDIGVEHEERHPAHLGLPDLGVQGAAAGEVQDDLARRPVGLPHEREREFVRVEDGIALLLPAVAREALAEVAVTVEQADADEGYAQVTGGLEMVSGKDAEPAGVLRQSRRHPELGREVGDGGGEPVALGVLLLVPPGAVQVLPEVGGRLGEPAEELLVPGQLGEAPGGHGTEQTHGVALRRPPGHGVDGLEELTGLGVPGPAQIAREVAERLKGVGEDGTHGESTNGLHVFHLYRGRTNPRGRTAVCAAPSPSTVSARGVPRPRRTAGSGCATPDGPASLPRHRSRPSRTIRNSGLIRHRRYGRFPHLARPCGPSRHRESCPVAPAPPRVRRFRAIRRTRGGARRIRIVTGTTE